MLEIDRRRLLVLSGVVALTTALPGSLAAKPKPVPSFKVGGFTISTLTDGHITLPTSFVAPKAPPAARAEALKAAGQSGTEIHSPLNVTLVRVGKEQILIDAGSGSRFVGTAGRLAEELETAGIDPEKITRVVFTHAHPDHLWGVMNDFDEVSFPNAIHYISEAEWNFWMSKDALSQVAKDRQGFVIGAQKNLKLVKDKIQTIKPGQDIMSGLHVLDTSGHTPGHVSIQIGNGNDAVVILGDALTHPTISFKHPDWRPAADQIPDRAVTTRKRLLARLAADKTRIIGYHLPTPGLGMVKKKETGYIYAPAS